MFDRALNTPLIHTNGLLSDIFFIQGYQLCGFLEKNNDNIYLEKEI